MQETPVPRHTRPRKGIEKYDTLAKTLTYKQFMALDLPKPSWHVDNYLPKSSLVFFAGAPGSYKTFFALKLAYALATGTPLFNRVSIQGVDNPPEFPNPALTKTNVLFIEEEMNPALVQERMKLFARENITAPDNLHFLVSGGVKMTDEGHMQELVSFIEEHKIEVIFMDPFSSVGGFEDENNNAEVSKTLDALRRTVVDSTLRTAVVLLHHPSKGAANKGASASALRGAGDILGKCDHAIVFEKSDVMPQSTLTIIKSRLADHTALPVQTILFNKVADFSPSKNPADWDATKISLELVASVSRAEMRQSANLPKKRDTKQDVLAEHILEVLRTRPDGMSQKDAATLLNTNATGTFLRSWMQLLDSGKITKNIETRLFFITPEGTEAQTVMTEEPQP